MIVKYKTKDILQSVNLSVVKTPYSLFSSYENENEIKFNLCKQNARMAKLKILYVRVLSSHH